MQCEQIFKDITEIHARLFDHRPAIQGHVDYFLKEFEEKRGDREKLRLKGIETAVADIKDKFLPESKDAMDAFLTNLIAKLKVATEVCKKIEEKENNIEIPYLEDQREQRKKNWEDFMQRQFERSAEVDQEYDAQVIKLSKEYSDLEDKLISDYKTRP
ncbi:hypothetical protein ACJMK2_002559 [Sinanodonta woodiana]|uniref:Biogenesis of lysosome-related organelles complex 1 subunit 5 n=1 Tax=Sinanodonta woodiana TaxID=1069815 RepID=A0ABD3XZ49_SINWO